MDIPKTPAECTRKSECRLTASGQSVTCIGWAPVFDGNGKRVDDGDPNISSWTERCETCGGRWAYRSQRGETTCEAVS